VTTNSASNRQQVIRDLDAFVFFHLGSDATVQVEKTPVSIKITLEHRRVQAFQFTLEDSEIEIFARSPEAFEAFMLDHLTQHRRS